jgi:hypothetical protein
MKLFILVTLITLTLAQSLNLYPFCVLPNQTTWNGDIDNYAPLYCPNNTDYSTGFVATTIFWLTDVGTYYMPKLSFTQNIVNQSDFTVTTCSMAGAESYNCESACVYDYQSSLTCGGTSTYCSWHACVNNSDCFCNTFSYEERLQVIDDFDGSHHNVTGEDILNVFLPQIKHIDQITVSKRSFKRQLLNSNGPVVFSSDLTNGILTIQSSVQGSYQALLTKGPWSSLLTFNSTVFQYTLPSDVYFTTGSLQLSVYVSGISVYTNNFQILGRQICLNVDCIFCISSMSNWSCLFFYQKMFIVIILILLVMLVVIALPAAIYMMVMLIKCALMPFRFCFWAAKGVWKSKFRKDIKDRVKSVYNKKDYFFSTETDTEAKAGMVIMCILLLSFNNANAQVVTSACSSGVFIPSSYLNCQVNGDVEVCDVQFSLTTTLQNIGYASCFSIVKPNNQSDVLATGVINFLSSNAQVGLSYQYTTMHWTGVQSSVHRCSGAGPCPEGCTGIYNNDISAQGQVNSAQVQEFIGQSRCDRGCGCVSCGGCFLCDQSCVYSRYSILPSIWNNTVTCGGPFNSQCNYSSTIESDLFVQVYQPISYNTQPIVSLTIYNSVGNVIYSTTASITGNVYQAGPYNLQVIGSLSGPLTLFSDNYVMLSVSDGTAYYGPASKANGPVAGSIGEVQGQNWKAMMLGAVYYGYTVPTGSTTTSVFNGLSEWNYLKYDPSIVAASIGGQTTHYNFVNSALAGLIENYPKFPMQISGNLWNVYSTHQDTDTQLYSAYMNSTLSSSPAIIVSMTTNQVVSLARNVNVVCPVGQYLNATGCFSCVMGSTILISVKSACSIGPVVVSSDNSAIIINTNVLIINSSFSTFSVNVYTPFSTNSFNLILTGSGSNITIPVNFVATQYSVLGNNTGGNNGGNLNSTGSGGINWDNIKSFFDSLFNGSWKWWQYLLLPLVILATIALFILSIPMITNIYVWVKNVRFRRSKVKQEEFPKYSPEVPRNMFSDKVAEKQGLIRRKTVADILREQQLEKQKMNK